MKFLQRLVLSAIAKTTARMNGLLSVINGAQEQILTIRDIMDHLEEDVRVSRPFYNDVVKLITWWKQPQTSLAEIQFRVKLINLAVKHAKLVAVPELQVMKLRLVEVEFAVNVNTIRLAGIRSEFYQFI